MSQLLTNLGQLSKFSLTRTNLNSRYEDGFSYEKARIIQVRHN